MGRRLTYKKPVRRTTENRAHRRLEQKADAVLNSHPERLRENEAVPEKSYYRSVGSVLSRDGKWFACNGQGEVVGEFKERWQAWAHADKYGMERAGIVG